MVDLLRESLVSRSMNVLAVRLVIGRIGAKFAASPMTILSRLYTPGTLTFQEKLSRVFRDVTQPEPTPCTGNAYSTRFLLKRV